MRDGVEQLHGLRRAFEGAPLCVARTPTRKEASRATPPQSRPLETAKRKEATRMADPRESQRERESPGSRPEPSRSAPAEETEQLVVTISAATREIVKIEKVDKAGKRDELSEEECEKLAGEDEVEEIAAALEEAFEAGIAGALGEADEDDEAGEDDEERAVRRILAGGVPRRRPVLGRLRRRFLRRLLLRRLLRRRLLQRRLHR
jgi:hypothetical protein